MKYSKDFVWECIGIITPGLKSARDAGCEMNLPSCLQSCAVQILIDDIDARDMKWSYAKMVIQEALRELHNQGWMEFGDKNQMWM